MATAILTYDFKQFPEQISGLDGYDHALIHVKVGGRYAGRFWVRVISGAVNNEALQNGLLESADWPFWQNWLDDFLSQDGPPAEAGLAAAVTVAVCTHNRPKDLQRCLAALARLPEDGQEVLVVDSASTSAETRQIAESFPGVRYVREERPGLNRARNRAFLEAKHEIVAFCDDDACPEPGWLRALAANFADPTVLCATGLTLPVELQTLAQEWFERYSPFSRGFRRRVYDKRSLHPMAAGRAGAGANMALRRSVLNMLGPFDEALDSGTPAQSGGDTEMYARILAAGYCVAYDPAAVSYHRHRRTWRGLRKTVYGYGVGTYAVWTRKLLFEAEFSVLILALQWFALYQLPTMLRALVRWPGHLPLDLVLAEWLGCASGPWAYLRSRRAGRA